MTVEALNFKEFKYLDQDKVADTEKDAQKKNYTVLLTVNSVLTNGDAEVELRTVESEIVNNRKAVGDDEKIDRAVGKQGEVCKAVINKTGKVVRILPVAGQISKDKKASADSGGINDILGRIIVPIDKVSGGVTNEVKDEFIMFPLENRGLECKGEDTDAKGRACVKYESEASSACKSNEEDLGKKNEELDVKEKRTVLFDKTLGVVISHNYTWDYESRYDTSYARVKETRRLSVQVNIAK